MVAARTALTGGVRRALETEEGSGVSRARVSELCVPSSVHICIVSERGWMEPQELCLAFASCLNLQHKDRWRTLVSLFHIYQVEMNLIPLTPRTCMGPVLGIKGCPCQERHGES